MDQNNMRNGVRQISPEEVAGVQGRPLTQEELQKTQVLNLQAVEEIAKFERMTSKKPAIILAIIGALFLTFGTTFQVAKTLHARNKSVIEQRNIKNDIPKVKKVEIPSLKCVLQTPDDPIGTDTTLTVNYDFDEDGLIRFTKVFDIKKTEGSTYAETTVQSYINAYKGFMNMTDGYEITVMPNATGLVVTVKVDFEKLDLTKLSPVQATHKSTSVDFAMGTTKEKIGENMKTQKYICE